MTGVVTNGAPEDALRQLPDLARLLVVAAHPDDETIGASAFMARAHVVRVVHVTDGAPAEAEFRPEGIAREAYARQRRGEAIAALSRLGIAVENVQLFGFRDLDASNHLLELTRQLASTIDEFRPTVVISHAYEGGHPDHDAVAFAASNAERILRKQGAETPVRMEMALYHGLPAFTVGRFLPDSAESEYVHELTADELELKHSMMRVYASQQHVLVDFYGLTEERWRRAPDYDFTRPPHAGELQYERWRMPMTAARWTALARAARERWPEWCKS